MNIVTKSFQLGDHTVTLETGRVARQATGSVMVNMADTVVLATVVGVPGDTEGRSFFPLTVEYKERRYAAGLIPGGYFKREGRPAEDEVLTARLIDRPIRPLFPKAFKNEVQIVLTVMSVNPEVSPDIPAMIGASAALAVSGLPFHGPIGAARVGYIDGQYVLNPSIEALENSVLDLVVAGTKEAVLMVESEAEELSEEVMLGAVLFGHEQMQGTIEAINALAKDGGKAPWNWTAPAIDDALEQNVAALVEEELGAAYLLHDKIERQEKISALKEKALAQFASDEANVGQQDTVKSIFGHIEKRIVRSRVLKGEPRIDGRDHHTVRPISIETGVLPRVHGSALFTRGETQAIVALTLGTGRDAQIVDALDGERRETFMLHYNFPPYSVGEAGFMGSPKRREIGHGRLAKRGIQAMLPSDEDFPYVIRIVSEITESNGSSSMASVCGSSLALMDAGVPMKAPVAGIAMGLVKEGDQYAILTDILGDEDHLGDMDFKVAGSVDGITALQMDIKISGITKEIMEKALAQANTARMHILNVMNDALAKPRDAMSDYAPRILTMQIDPEKIRDVIGKGGATIREIIDETGVNIDIDDNGVVNIAAVDGDAGKRAMEWVKLIVTDVNPGELYDGVVTKIVDFGAFVSVLKDKVGLVHISQIKEERVESVDDVLQEGQSVTVRVLEVDRQGKIRMTMKDVEQRGAAAGDTNSVVSADAAEDVELS
ncbi:MAG: polyribonucleotide nucleotidyltransferase [Gammaproteobacteria bacterium]